MSEVLRETRGTCPLCVEMVPARVVEDGGRIFLEKECPDHGTNRALISISPAYYRDLERYFFQVMPESFRQRDYILRLTGRCNMNCPICLASANEYKEEDLPFADILQLMDSGRRLKLDLMGAEPTLRSDLEEIMREARKRGHISALHTNGIKLGDPDYVRRLVEAGMDEVHLQFDGFSDAHDLEIRGQKMNENKRRALEALEQYGVATDLVVTVAQGSNEDEMVKVLDYAAGHAFVKEVFFLGCRRLGRATDDFADQCLVPDEVLEILTEKSGQRIRREDVRIFQKLYFALLAVFRVRKCFYIHHYLLTRRKGSWRPVSEEIDLPWLERRLDRVPALLKRSRWLGAAYVGFHSALAILRKGSFQLLFDGMVLSLMLLLGFDLSRVKRRPILLGFITACDPWIHDEAVSANCGKGEISTDVGTEESGAEANVKREKLHRTADGRKG
jgi:molybdenum cofactor biosynthesis enzyme MoaA